MQNSVYPLFVPVYFLSWGVSCPESRMTPLINIYGQRNEIELYFIPVTFSLVALAPYFTIS